jgi:hypothetical protein
MELLVKKQFEDIIERIRPFYTDNEIDVIRKLGEWLYIEGFNAGIAEAMRITLILTGKEAKTNA